MIGKLILLLTAPLLLEAILDQSLGIRGILRCGTKPLGNRTVRLYEKKTPPLPDVLMASNSTDSDGSFYLGGTAKSVLPLSPVLQVERDCKGNAFDNDDTVQTSGVIKLNITNLNITTHFASRAIKLPSSKTDITRTKEVRKYNDVGIINLSTVPS